MILKIPKKSILMLSFVTKLSPSSLSLLCFHYLQDKKLGFLQSKRNKNYTVLEHEEHGQVMAN